MDTGTRLLVEGNLAPRENAGFVFQTEAQTEAIYRQKPIYDFFKRAFDIVCSVVALVVLGPFLLFIMLMIYYNDGGSPVFVQERVGKDGKLFKVYKLRTMVAGAEKRDFQALENGRTATTVMYKCNSDPRVTEIGAWLRKRSIDELLQIINVLQGKMSVIGPRPLIPFEHNVLNMHFPLDRGIIKPGLSCYTVLDKHCRDSYENWVKLDIKYIRERCFITDVKIIFKTIAAVVLGKNT